MKTKETNIYVYAHWKGMDAPQKIGILKAVQIRGKKAFSFEYDSKWLDLKYAFLLDPDLSLFSGPQFPNNKENFGMILDSMPDTWGRTLMKRKAVQQAKKSGEKPPVLYEIDYLLGVYDKSRMGALRFKLEEDGPFLCDDLSNPTPPWSSLRELQHAIDVVELDSNSEEVSKWLSILLAPGSSLGGARPKANVLDDKGHPWIAKFPSKNDTIDKGAWEYLVYKLALGVGIEMTESQILKISGKYHTFLTRRFDRENNERIHFASAMNMCGYTEEMLRDAMASYLELAEKIKYDTARNKRDLKQLWTRIVFSIAVSNTDDHLRNHGFLLQDDGWVLSPAYDINPSIDKEGLALNIDMDDNSLDFELAKSVGVYFDLTEKDMNEILKHVKNEVSKWKKIANVIGIPRSEQEMMSKAFRV